MIICGFPGVGKSYVAKKVGGVVDLESTPFNKDFDTYINVAIHMNKNGYTPLVSSHEDMREKLLESGVKFKVVIPKLTDKYIYIANYKDRGNTPEFIELLNKNFDKWICDIMNDDRLRDKLVILDTNRYLKSVIDEFLDIWEADSIWVKKA